MTQEKFVHNEPDSFHGKELTLHDCIADKVSFTNNILRFNLPQGLWVTPHHTDNDYNKILRTDAAAVDFAVKDIDDISVRVFTRSKWPLSQKIYAEDWHIEQLLVAINNGRCTIEFITQYRSHFEQLWYCVIHSSKKPYYKECHLHLPDADATFHWNNLRQECEW